MPLVQRVVQPIDIVRVPLNKQYAGDDELQSVSMNALVGILRQLASLSKHAESLFADLFNEASFTMIKARNMETRVQNLAKRVAMETSYCQYDLNTHAVENGRYRHDVVVDQNVVTKDNRSLCVQERYRAADTTPNLVVFTNIREDGKDYTNLYTDPHFFSKTWLLQMQKEYDSNNRRGKTRKKRRNSMKKQPRAVTIKTYTVDHCGNKVIKEDQRVRKVVNTSAESPQPTAEPYPGEEDAGAVPPPLQPTDLDYTDNLPPPPELPLPPAFDDSYNLPPPDAPYHDAPYHDGEIVYEEPQPLASCVPVAPPPPAAPAAPPPPAALPAAAQPPSAPSLLASITSPPKLKAVVRQDPVEDSNKPKSLLDSIQNYSLNTLKKVTVEPKPENHYASMDVMSILNRRVVMQVSDSESEGSEGSGDAWEDEE